MKNIYEITIYTLREALAKKIFITFAIVSTLILSGLALWFAFIPMESLMGQGAQIKMDGVDIVEKIVIAMQVGLITPIFGIGIFLSIFSTANLIPNLLEKGNIDLFLSKPISRAQLLWGKFFGGNLIVLLNVAYLVFGIWFLIGLKFDYWGFSFLVTIITITFTFACLYALMILLGITTKNSVLAMMLAYLIYIILNPLLSARESLFRFVDNKFIESLIDGLYYLLPKTSELAAITVSLASGVKISDYQPILTSLLFMILMLAGSFFIFSKKDF